MPASRLERSVVLACSLAFAALLGAELASDFRPSKLGAVFVLAFWLPMLAVHALGHACAARLVGWRLAELGVGLGRELCSVHVGALRVSLRTLPIEGYALPQPGSLRHARARRAFVYLGGPLANLAVLALVALALERRLPAPGDGVATIALQSLGLDAALGGLLALLPYRAAGNPSDGLALLECAFASRAVLHERLLWPLLAQARRLIWSEQPARARSLLAQALARLPGEPRLLGACAVTRAAEGDPQAAYAELEALGAPEGRAPALRAELIADAAWCVLLGRDSALLANAQRAAERAAELCPDDPHYELLLARAAFERGQLEDAYAGFSGVYARARDAEQEAQCIAFLALVCRALAPTTSELPLAEHAARFEAAVRSRPMPPGLRRRVLRDAARAD